MNKKWAAQNSGQLENDIIEISALLVRNAISIIVYEPDVFHEISSSESSVSLLPILHCAAIALRPS